jgi:hypothetical protein
MKVDLLETLARICYCAQENICDPEFHSTELYDRECAFLNTSYVIACFLAQNTVNGNEGVESEIVLEQLIDIKLDGNGYMLKSLDKWKDIICNIANEFGGFKK